MKISEIANLIGGDIVCCKDKCEQQIYSACASDMMSDVLAFVHEQAMLITGLTNPQVIRTAEMMDMKCVVLVRGKQPDKTMIQLATQKNIVLITSDYRMFETIGILYSAGLKP